VNRTATPPLPARAPSVPGGVAIGTMPCPSRAPAIPGAVVTEVSPPVSRTWCVSSGTRGAADADALAATGTEVTYTAEFAFKGAARYLAPLLRPVLARLGDRAENGLRQALSTL